LSLLETKRGAQLFRDELPHFRHFDNRFIQRIPPADQTVAGVLRIMEELGAGELCVVISETAMLHGRELPLRSALLQTLGHSQGTVLWCRPRSLAYYEGEEPGDRFILRGP
jgi:hypothetical protein